MENHIAKVKMYGQAEQSRIHRLKNVNKHVRIAQTFGPGHEQYDIHMNKAQALSKKYLDNTYKPKESLKK